MIANMPRLSSANAASVLQDTDRASSRISGLQLLEPADPPVAPALNEGTTDIELKARSAHLALRQHQPVCFYGRGLPQYLSTVRASSQLHADARRVAPS